ncbi:hypothetical protein DH2020_017527 [Rehmannia glutinosa]|uniref:Uncharacterized protein n=1 Tax=Rehmannia glutinosa TaxID=99300 RepID=A0ABR0WR59_REHGL
MQLIMALTSSWKLILAATVVMLGMWTSQSTARTLPNASMVLEKHENWMAQFGRAYKDDAEKAMRFKIFKENVEYIESFNEAGAKLPYKLAINKFADLTNEEFKTSRNGFKMGSHPKPSYKVSSFKYANVIAVPASMDWRMKGAVTAVKNQGQCGTCWAFSVVATIEAINQIKTGQLLSLSEQQLVDCDDKEHGCEGGFKNNAFEFIVQNGGITTETNYPYVRFKGICDTMKASEVAVQITGYEVVPANNETALLQAVANQPVSVSIDSSSLDSQFYSSGVLTGGCGTNVDHEVAVVGYGTTTDGIKYWLVKNSWGQNWGEDGYFRIQRDVPQIGGLCGIATTASYPTMII